MEVEQQMIRQEKRRKIKKEMLSWGKTLAIVLVIVVFVRAFLFTNYIVYGNSMMPTIKDRDRVIINKIGYDIGTPQRFDMIVFHATEETDYIKRVIGLPGDQITYSNDLLYINGEAVEEVYLNGVKEKYKSDSYTEDFKLEEITDVMYVPENHIFVLGDNRRNSMDSRHIGFVSFEEIVGKADITYWPLTHFRKLK
ncbi:signal peptidase I [Bacillaceae bacterium IKA-2]|nr:signal peptidase I [Bacillaceae bacterium IKA-2]